MSASQVRRLLQAPRPRVYEALIDAEAVARWRFPAEMTCEVHEFDAREGGAIRISLTYESRDRRGKSHGSTDSYRGRFVRLVPDELVVEADEFETDDPALRGEMVSTISLSDRDGATELVAVHDQLPPGLSRSENEAGWREALARLAVLVEDP